jgi:hypothetical protein
MDYAQIREELRSALGDLQASQVPENPEPDWARLQAAREAAADHPLMQAQLGILHAQYRVNYETGQRLLRLEQFSVRALTTLIDLTETLEQGR